jgi:hypothetical protein
MVKETVWNVRSYFLFFSNAALLVQSWRLILPLYSSEWLSRFQCSRVFIWERTWYPEAVLRQGKLLRTPDWLLCSESYRVEAAYSFFSSGTNPLYGGIGTNAALHCFKLYRTVTIPLMIAITLHFVQMHIATIAYSKRTIQQILKHLGYTSRLQKLSPIIKKCALSTCTIGIRGYCLLPYSCVGSPIFSSISALYVHGCARDALETYWTYCNEDKHMSDGRPSGETASYQHKAFRIEWLWIRRHSRLALLTKVCHTFT